MEALNFEGVEPVRRWGLAVAIAGVVAVTALPASSHGSVVRFDDPHGDGLVDVWSTRKATVHTQSGRHRLRVRVHGDLYADWDLIVYVDSRRGDRGDFKFWAYQSLGKSDCGARRLYGPTIHVACEPGSSYETTVWWSVRRSVLHPDKRIRWRAVTFYPGANPYPGPPEDHAPDDGWYPRSPLGWYP